MRNFALAAAIVLLLNIGGLSWRALTGSVEDSTNAKMQETNANPLPVDPIVPSQVAVQVEPLPIAVRLPVPFSSQAPYNTWNQPWQDACEEMAFLMVKSFMEGPPGGPSRTSPVWTPETASAAIKELVHWETSRGFGGSITLEELAEIIREKYPEYIAVISTDVSVAHIEQLLREGKPVIVPTAGRELLNPYFSEGGPWYHMLVITGYDDKNFITNDPGTKAGEGYVYEKNHLLSTIHNWTGVNETIGEGQKLLMTIENRNSGELQLLGY